ncbi:aspartic peptidase domain-containing protein [Amanita rubescens]|nr:aspartic peptidase domain-containing protein [Amanita rubescens]
MKFNLLAAVMALTLTRLAHGTGHGSSQHAAAHRSSPHGSSLAEEHNSDTNHPVYTLPLKYHPAEDFEDENIWTGEITIATQVFNVIFATVWIIRLGSLTLGGKSWEKHQMKDPFTPQHGHRFIDYKQRGTRDMKRRGDNVKIGRILLRRQHFCTVGHFTPYFLRRPLDGVLGLAFPELADNHYDPFFYAAYQQRTRASVPVSLLSISPRVIPTSYRLGMMLGYNRYIQKMIGGGLVKMTYKDGNGQVKTDVIASGIRTIIDSGTDMILGPADAVKRIYERIPFSRVIKNSVGLDDHVFPCNLPIEGKEFPKITFSWGGAEWDLSLDSFILARFSRYEERPITKPAVCRGAIQEKPASDEGPDIWVLGTR